MWAERLARRLSMAARRHADGTLWRAAAFALMINLVLAPSRFPPAALTIGRAYMGHFWRLKTFGEWIDLLVAILLWPIGVVIAALWFTHRNGSYVAQHFGRSRIDQFVHQLQLAMTSGLMPPWYYIFEFYRPGELRRARSYFTRGQTKYGAYPIIARARERKSLLANKAAFALFCADRQISALPVLCSAQGGKLSGSIESADGLPRSDLFLKPMCGRGGRGAERWDFVGEGVYCRVDGLKLSAPEFLKRLCDLSRVQPFILQERALNHPAMRELSNGALSTVRMISCLDEQCRPEIVAAVLRMATGKNVTVDNVHAGGLAAAIDLDQGRLSLATNMGIDARFGWVDRHPDTGALISDRIVPSWSEACALVCKAHSAFCDWIVVGWDVAITSEGARLVEGNGSPDIELIQRPLQKPFGDGRFGELLALHLSRVGNAGTAPDAAVSGT